MIFELILVCGGIAFFVILNALQQENNSRLKTDLDFSKLFRRETEVVRLAAKGYTNAQIAEELFIV